MLVNGDLLTVMLIYPDTSFLCALYRKQTNSDRALAYRAKMAIPLVTTPLLLWEFRQGVRFQAFRHSQNPKVGYPLIEAEKMIRDLEDDLENGLVQTIPCNFGEILHAAERISKNRTFTGGHRSFDLLHIATALTLGAKVFLTFDANQTALAQAEGFSVPLASPIPA